MLLTKDQILKADDLSFEEVNVKEWGGMVRVRMMTAGERDDYESAIYDFNLDDGESSATLNRDNFRAQLVIRTVCDENGKLMFSKGDIPALSSKGAGPIQKIFNAATKLNGITAEDEEELVKN